MPGLTKEILIGFSKNKQSAIGTANTAAGMWRLNKLNASQGAPKLNTEDDAAEFGSGIQFATTRYKTYWDTQGVIEKYLSAEFAAWVFAFGLGKCVKSGTTPNWIYTCTPLNPVTDGLELPYFSFVEQIRSSSATIVDRMTIGNAINSFTLALSSGPGRASSKLTVNYVGSGKHAKPSVIVIPDATAEKLLSGASLALTAHSVNYVTAKKINSLEFTWNNNLRLDRGFYPGSGFQTTDPTSGAVRGRMEIGVPELTLKISADLDKDSAEEAAIEAQSEGTAVFSLTYDANNSLTVTVQRTQISAADPDDNSGLTAVNVEFSPLWHTSNGLVTAVAKCNVDGIAQAEA